MPFGLVNSGALFCRMMRVLLKGLENTDNFVDDIIVHTHMADTDFMPQATLQTLTGGKVDS